MVLQDDTYMQVLSAAKLDHPGHFLLQLIIMFVNMQTFVFIKHLAFNLCINKKYAVSCYN